MHVVVAMARAGDTACDQGRGVGLARLVGVGGAVRQRNCRRRHLQPLMALVSLYYYH